MNPPLIQLDHLGIGYGGETVLSDLSFSIPEGSYTAILGANGSGKSTLLKTILGLIPPVGGSISFSRDPMNFGYVPQSVHFDPIYLLTGYDVALMGVYGRVGPGRRIPAAEREFARECLRAAGADLFSRRPFAHLSGGQKQRVLIARALATRPQVMVLDEPTAGVDREGAHAVLDFISKIRQERHIAVLLVTHDFWAVHRYAEQFLWLQHGKFLSGSPDELLKGDRIADIFEIGTD
jgi:ABC-type Mn2+/Zn2+ transport system ATPase subunit